MSVPDIATLRQRANTIISRAGSGQMRAMLAGICAAKNTGDPLPADSTGQQLITECQQIIDQADSDALAIFVREFMEFVENAGDSMGCCDQVAEILTIVQRTSLPSEIPPLVLGPNPTIGAYGTRYTYQVNSYGTLPITFAVTAGALPTGLSLDANSGLIVGTCTNANAGLYNFTITATNEFGSVAQAFTILIEGTGPVTTYSGSPQRTLPAALNTFTANTTGSHGGYPAVPFTYEWSPDYLPAAILHATLDADTGEITVTPEVTANGNSYPIGVITTGYFGDSLVGVTLYVLAPIYWGEWHGALPGTFTASNITADLFDNTTPGPRIMEGPDTFTWLVQQGELMEFPATGVAYARVMAIPQGTLTGELAMSISAGLPWTIVDSTNVTVPCPDLTPAWPTPYQSGLVIDGVPYDIYVITARTADIWLIGNYEL